MLDTVGNARQYGHYGSRYVDVNKTLEKRAAQLAALGHPARLALLREIVQRGPEGTTTTDLQAKLDIPWTTLSHHLDRLVDGGLVATRREGKFAFHTADYKALRTLTDYLWEDCCKNGKGAAKECC
jgi:ArsR family transcriptional regulator, arsenate/arsenite/antimonite-responsive transcriptional repressor